MLAQRQAYALLLLTLASLGSVAQTGPPDTMASCLGMNACARCVLFVPTAEPAKRFTVVPRGDQCAELKGQRLAYSASLDVQTHAYALRSDISDPNSIAQLHYNANQRDFGGAPGGAAGSVLGSSMYQHYEAIKSDNMKARVQSIEANLKTTTGNLDKSYKDTRASIPFNDNAVAARLQSSVAQASVAAEASLARIEALRTVPREALPARAADADPFAVAGASRELISQAVMQRVPPAQRRAGGRDLGGAMQRTPGLAGASRAELAKADAARGAGKLNAESHARIKAQLEAAVELSGSSEAKGRALAERAVADAQSERQVAEGKSDTREVTTVDADGNASTATYGPGQALPDNAVGPVVGYLYYRVRAAESYSDKAAAAALAYQGIDAAQRRDAANRAQALAEAARTAFQRGDLGDSEILSEFAIGCADLATSWVPWLSVPRSIYELVSGRDAFSGEKLSDLEIAGRVLDIVSAGLGSKVVKGWDAVNRISRHIGDVPHIRDILQSAKKFEERMARLGKNAHMDVKDLKHIADRHMPGGVDVGTRGALDTVFANGVDPLNLAGEAAELVSAKSPNVKRVISRSQGSSDFFLWERGTKVPAIGRGANDRTAAHDVAVVFERADGRLVNTFPWHPNNPRPPPFDLEDLR